MIIQTALWAVSYNLLIHLGSQVKLAHTTGFVLFIRPILLLQVPAPIYSEKEAAGK